MDDSSNKTTDFGYQQVPISQKQEKVGEVFHSVAQKYDLMNDLMSLGIHRVWKHFAVGRCDIKPGQTVLDIAGGTGDLSLRISPMVGKAGKVIMADINASMLKVGRDRLLDEGIVDNIDIVQANAECLPLEDDSVDRILIGFGLRNVTDKNAALRSMYRILKPGGRLIILEFSKPTTAVLSKVYDTYSFHLLPKLGKWIAKDADSYQYLAESIRMHPDQLTLRNMMESAGFENASFHNLTGGIVALHIGFKY